MQALTFLMDLDAFDLRRKSGCGTVSAAQLDDAAHIELDAGEGLQTGWQRGEIVASAAMPGVGELGVVKVSEINQLLWSRGVPRRKKPGRSGSLRRARVRGRHGGNEPGRRQFRRAHAVSDDSFPQGWALIDSAVESQIQD